MFDLFAKIEVWQKTYLIMAFVTVGTVFLSAVKFPAQTQPKNPIHQLRIYDIPRENREAFHERFKYQAMRIMKKYGFRIVAIWEAETDQKLEFVYLLEWKDKQTMAESWKKFLADAEWIEIKKKSDEKYGTCVNEVREKTLTLTNYSPRTTFFE